MTVNVRLSPLPRVTDAFHFLVAGSPSIDVVKIHKDEVSIYLHGWSIDWPRRSKRKIRQMIIPSWIM